MTTSCALRPLPDRATVVDVYGSRFLLEWLDRDTLATAAATARCAAEVERTEECAAG
ncbi:hypothetical protein ACI79J_13880 [Geodermatophilus sp. SYSU D01062]